MRWRTILLIETSAQFSPLLRLLSIILFNKLFRICAGVFCDSCCILPADSASLLFVGNSKQSATKQSANSKQTGNAEETSLASMRICDGEKITLPIIIADIPPFPDYYHSTDLCTHVTVRQ